MISYSSDAFRCWIESWHEVAGKSVAASSSWMLSDILGLTILSAPLANSEVMPAGVGFTCAYLLDDLTSVVDLFFSLFEEGCL